MYTSKYVTAAWCARWPVAGRRWTELPKGLCAPKRDSTIFVGAKNTKAASVLPFFRAPANQCRCCERKPVCDVLWFWRQKEGKSRIKTPKSGEAQLPIAQLPNHNPKDAKRACNIVGLAANILKSTTLARCAKHINKVCKQNIPGLAPLSLSLSLCVCVCVCVCVVSSSTTRFKTQPAQNNGDICKTKNTPTCKTPRPLRLFHRHAAPAHTAFSSGSYGNTPYSTASAKYNLHAPCELC